MICIGRNSTYRLRYWNQPNTVAILHLQLESRNSTYRLRYWNIYKLPFSLTNSSYVATVLTVYGIETYDAINRLTSSYNVATVLTVYGIETIILVKS